MAPTVDSRYELGELVASGGMADVHRGRDRVLERPVAIKRLRGPVDDAAARERFEREARLLAGFNHPNAVAVFDTVDAEDGAFIVMEYVEGRTLRAVLRQEGRLDVDRATSIATQLLDALAAAHARGIVHRDIKPGNVLVTDEGHVKLADFGIATMADAVDLTRTGEVVGTPKYLSPEQVVGKRATPLSDLYAVGVLCYEMVCGHVPFEGDSALATMAAHRRAPVPSLREACPWVPDWYVAVVERALAKDPAQRYPDAGAMRRALLAGARGDVTVADSTIPLPVMVDARGSRAPAAATPWPVLAFLVLGALVALGVWALGDDGTPPTRRDDPATDATAVPAATQPPPTQASAAQPAPTAPPATTPPATAAAPLVDPRAADDGEHGAEGDDHRGPGGGGPGPDRGRGPGGGGRPGPRDD